METTRITDPRGAELSLPRSANRPGSSTRPASSLASCTPYVAGGAKLVRLKTPDPSPAASSVCDEFTDMLEKEIRKVEEHFHYEAALLRSRIDGVEAELQMLEDEMDLGKRSGGEELVRSRHHAKSTEDLPDSSQRDFRHSKTDYSVPKTNSFRRRDTSNEKPYIDPKAERARQAHLMRLQKAIVALWDISEKIQSFVQLNHLAVYKILKKRDKMFGLSLRDKEFHILSLRFQRLQIRPSHLKRMKKLYARANYKQSCITEPYMVNLAAAVQRHFMRQQNAQLTLVPFLLGVSLMIVVDLFVLSFVQPRNPLYSLESLLAVFPIYRLFFTMILSIWTTGLDVWAFETAGVNYKFLLDIDPRSDIKSVQILRLAGELTCIWIFCFAFFYIDFRFAIFDRFDHFWTHPIAFMVLMLTSMLVLCGPSVISRILRIFWIVFKCSFSFPTNVTFEMNIVGDVFTSLAKSIADIEYIGCYYKKGLWHWSEPRCEGSNALTTFLIMIPFWIRFVQCFARYRAEKRSVHIFNMFKYLTAMIVILVTNVSWGGLLPDVSIYTKRLCWVFLYLLTSLYSMAWDFFLDWGLIPEADTFLRKDMLFNTWVYYMITMVNLGGRLTWVLTLTPLKSNQLVTSCVLSTAAGLIELIRRSAWALLRLENEHLTNSSRYRAMLWVPRLGETLLEKDEAASPVIFDREHSRSMDVAGSLDFDPPRLF